MLALLLSAAAATAGPPAPQLPETWSPPGEARTVMERQFRTPPRAGTSGGLSPEEADTIMARYLSSIGKLLQPAAGPVRSGQPQ